ncbi:hypothetical protein EMIHUDRAFT_460761 [Emiliania huxleyi CCMP1516]|uniref:Uncharacterized protein n=2 Tax=Emiliania huxleyi TaxID=2903 RepID=A0A0D3JL37_EMIH1|nr:hypothetical protein EMIHUDRAFT_460761 [Emiliania huxleyi CCMP1516]EOD24222.1 hypothetical protein EMIHUDRAFT_460761 [Emiliania huxleyi CCMP1516]|eukprot:XP_005776651.1 hypothetical protein EMIHUDRAFT_460761 [Emiliania huxleyi CCMP1516]
MPCHMHMIGRLFCDGGWALVGGSLLGRAGRGVGAGAVRDTTPRRNLSGGRAGCVQCVPD